MIPTILTVCFPSAAPVAVTNDLSNWNAFGEKPLLLRAYKPKLVAELVIEQYPPD